jgi:hypothetical protein
MIEGDMRVITGARYEMFTLLEVTTPAPSMMETETGRFKPTPGGAMNLIVLCVTELTRWRHEETSGCGCPFNSLAEDTHRFPKSMTTTEVGTIGVAAFCANGNSKAASFQLDGVIGVVVKTGAFTVSIRVGPKLNPIKVTSGPPLVSTRRGKRA